MYSKNERQHTESSAPNSFSLAVVRLEPQLLQLHVVLDGVVVRLDDSVEVFVVPLVKCHHLHKHDAQVNHVFLNVVHVLHLLNAMLTHSEALLP